MTPRRATRDDMPAVARLHREVRRRCLPFLQERHAPEDDERFFTGPVADTCETWVAEEDGLRGFVSFRPGHVDHLYVRPDAQGRGVGTALLECATSRHDTLALWTFQQNEQAQRFYLTLGWRPIAHTDGSENEERTPDTQFAWPPAPAEPLRLLVPTMAALPHFIAAMNAGWSPSSTRDVRTSMRADIAADTQLFLRALTHGEGMVTLADGQIVPRLPGATYWLWDGAFAGTINFRHVPGGEDLPPHASGHIGYGVVPWKRGRGYAKRALALILPSVRSAGMARVSLTCDATNGASRKVIEANGGVLDGIVAPAAEDHPAKLRYWIDLSA